MDQFNKSSYKKETLTQQFYHSCLGKVIIFLAVSLILFIVGIIMLPSNDMIKAETIDNVHQCLQDNDSIKVMALTRLSAILVVPSRLLTPH